MEIKTMLEDLVQLERDSAKLQEIKRIMHNDGSIDIIEQITHLQNNTQVNNINKLNQELERIEEKIEDVQGDYSQHYDEAQEAIRCLDNIVDYSDYIDEAVSVISDLRLELNQLDDETTAKKTTAKKTTEQK
jgi:tRNA/tmRNA/rRNA uracil-C5-methylase (TrmA/RlmC/RlmD family)